VTLVHLRTCQPAVSWTQCFLSLPAEQSPAASGMSDRRPGRTNLLSRSDPALLLEPDWWLSGCGGFDHEGTQERACLCGAG
jgi:hypothetical protein